MDYLKKVVISLTNKTIQIWNLQKQKLLLTIDMLNGNMHNLVFNDQFQLILTSGFQKEVLLFQIDHKNEVYKLILGIQQCGQIGWSSGNGHMHPVYQEHFHGRHFRRPRLRQSFLFSFRSGISRNSLVSRPF
jgi:hypothetical protein